MTNHDTVCGNALRQWVGIESQISLRIHEGRVVGPIRTFVYKTHLINLCISGSAQNEGGVSKDIQQIYTSEIHCFSHSYSTY